MYKLLHQILPYAETLLFSHTLTWISAVLAAGFLLNLFPGLWILLFLTFTAGFLLNFFPGLGILLFCIEFLCHASHHADILCKCFLHFQISFMIWSLSVFQQVGTFLFSKGTVLSKPILLKGTSFSFFFQT